MKKKKIVLLLTFGFTFILFGASYAFFQYNKIGLCWDILADSGEDMRFAGAGRRDDYPASRRGVGKPIDGRIYCGLLIWSEHTEEVSRGRRYILRYIIATKYILAWG